MTSLPNFPDKSLQLRKWHTFSEDCLTPSQFMRRSSQTTSSENPSLSKIQEFEKLLSLDDAFNLPVFYKTIIN